jgi:hypothetical protein
MSRKTHKNLAARRPNRCEPNSTQQRTGAVFTLMPYRQAPLKAVGPRMGVPHLEMSTEIDLCFQTVIYPEKFVRAKKVNCLNTAGSNETKSVRTPDWEAVGENDVLDVNLNFPD